MDVQDLQDGSYNGMYMPPVPGEYAIRILDDEEDIPGSPWMVEVLPFMADFNPEKVCAFGAGG